MPNVILEAMAAGKPVVCSLVEGSEELISGAESHQGFSPGDCERMASLVEQFQSDELLCKRIGSANQQRVRFQHSLRVMTDAYREHYRTLLTRRLDVS
jgi:starch synthase (maltosyl-transferring)